MIQITDLPLLGSWDWAEAETAAHSEAFLGLKQRFLMIKTTRAGAVGCPEVVLHLGCEAQ